MAPSQGTFGQLMRLLAGLGALALVVIGLRVWLDVPNPTVAALAFLLIILVAAASSRLWVSVVMSFAAMLALNFYFLPPIGNFTIADPQNWVALFVFLGVSLIGSNLSAAVRARELEAQSRRDELSRLFDLSRDVLVMTDSQALTGLARSVANRFALSYAAIALPTHDARSPGSSDPGWEIFDSGELSIDPAVLTADYERITAAIEFDARARTYAGHATHRINGEDVRVVPLRVGTRPIGLFAAAGRPIEPGTLDVLAGVVAIAIERARFLDERKTAELTRQSEELKTTLLASVGHDLRTPLTAIRVAAANLRDTWLGEAERRDQADVILTEVERLTRLFQNILSMAQIDAGPIAPARQWTVPSELIAAAREQVEQTLRRHRVDIQIESDDPIRLDARLAATALAHVLENAAQYSPPDTTIRVRSGRDGETLVLAVHDAGPGISAADLPHLFERFYRGESARTRSSGTGMGLSIARGLLAAQGGRVWVENDPAGGAVFTISVPVERHALQDVPS